MEHIYESANSNFMVHNSIPFIPNIRDGDGYLIMPDKYENLLEDEGLVIVNVHPRM